MSDSIAEIGKRVKASAPIIASADTATKNRALRATAEILIAKRNALITENNKDLVAASARKIGAALIDRLELNDDRINAMADGLLQIAELDDPVGMISDLSTRPSGIRVGRMRVPLGVIGMIYESRPNVTIDAAALCIKAGNAVLLRGGSEAIYSNIAIAKCLTEGLQLAGLPVNCVQLIQTPGRQTVAEMLKLDDCIDVIIPRGGKQLVKYISRESSIPVIKHLDGVCHVYIDDGADLEQALTIAVNAKTQRYGVCNAMETLLVAQSVAEDFLPRYAHDMQIHQVEIRGCEQSCAIVPEIKAACETDWHEEYLAPIIAIKIVAGIDEAIAHIARYGSHHTDAIVSRDYARTMRFIREIDSSSVMVNASTRFADGYEYGLGAEIGISTDRLHVRGPVGLEGLTIQKYIVFGDGHIRE
ncbi:MAG: glutamate-5-semialdehyde dehydrogenase [Chromatiales bacterium]|nr:glutamate-5-semialdehyde dehydrogenase [Chromatiales bacterium]